MMIRLLCMILILSEDCWASSCIASLREAIQVLLAANVFLLGAGAQTFRAHHRKGSFRATLVGNLLLVCNFNDLEMRMSHISDIPAFTPRGIAR